MTVEHGVEDGEHAPLELAAPRHGERGERGLRRAVRRRAERLDHLEQIGGVARGLGAVEQHVVVARVLALELHAAHGDPHQRIEPEQGEGDLTHELGERVEPLHVRHLVHEHVAAPLLRPLVGILGEQHHGVDDPPGDRHAEPVAAHQRERASDAQRVGEALRERQPAAVVDTLAPAREPSHDDGADAEPEQYRRRAEHPQHEQDRDWRERAMRRRCDGGGR